MRNVILSAGLCVGLWASSALAESTLKTKHFSIGFKDGAFVSLKATASGTDYLAAGQPAPILQVRVAGALHAPDGMDWDAQTEQLSLRFSKAGVAVVVAAKAKPTHVTLTVLSVTPKEKVELIVWGPYPTTINRTIGEMVGVVRDQAFGLGIQVLNPKTMGGYPAHPNDPLQRWYAEDENHYKEAGIQGGKRQRFWNKTAARTDVGSVLQAYCRDRSRERETSWGGYNPFTTSAINDGGTVGSAIALFGCPEPEILSALEAIELAEGLPHVTTADGQWVKGIKAGPSALLIDFTEANFEEALALTKRAGVDYLYSRFVFQTWGSYKLRPDKFPNGREGFRKCVEMAAREGVQVGVHALCFITVTESRPYLGLQFDNDPMVSSGGQYLGSSGTSLLQESVDAALTSIPVEDPTFFRRNHALNAVRIDSEVIQYEKVSAAAPWILLGCERGKWGTKAAAHKQGAAVAKLMEHEWRCFLPSAEGSKKMGQAMAEFCNETGVTLWGFDGLEGARFGVGSGLYGWALLVDEWYKTLKPELQGKIANEASGAVSFNWHAITHYAWGELDGYSRSSNMANYRADQQPFYIRNYLPRHLGYYLTKWDAKVHHVEFMLAQAAGFDAGFNIELRGYMKGENLGPLLDAVKIWHSAQNADVFPEALKPALQDPANSFHVENLDDNRWSLYPVLTMRAPTINEAAKSKVGTVWGAGVLGEPITLPFAGSLDEETLRRFDTKGKPQGDMPETSSSRKDIPGHLPANAVDGIRTLESSWWADPFPAMWQMDLGKPKRLKGVHVWPYWGLNRYYQYTVEVSADGKDWQQVGDMSKNTTASTPEGDQFEFEFRDVRYVRVNVLYHNRNAGVHLVEVDVIEE